MVHPKCIAILDFGSQYTHLIGNRVRSLGAYTEIVPPETSAEDLKNAAGIILSGGPQSVYDTGSPQADPKIFDLGIPILGVCYGLQWIAHTQAQKIGKDGVKPGTVKEYGRTAITIKDGSTIFKGCPTDFVVWMSHGDEAVPLDTFPVVATSENGTKIAAFENTEKKIFGLQFHPEVKHTENGMTILKNFIDMTDHASWSIDDFAKHIGDDIKKKVDEKKVFMLVSGGVDSTVAFTLLNEVLGSENVQGLLVDTGLMRKNEVQDIQSAFQELNIDNLHVYDASEEFLENLKDVYEPEEKRKIIGDTFLSVQKRVSEKMDLKIDDGWMLGQGTIYPDTIETGGTKHADTIKTHHNRVEAVQKMIEQGLVIEPLSELYKDEVRKLGEQLGLPHALVWRHPFPGPGLGVRILCAHTKNECADPLPVSIVPKELSNRMIALPVQSVGVQGDQRTYRHPLAFFVSDWKKTIDLLYPLATSIPNKAHAFNRVLLCLSQEDIPREFSLVTDAITEARADLLRDADAIVTEEMRKADLYEAIWQFPVVLLPIGIDGTQSIVLRPVESIDAMTAGVPHIPHDVLERMAAGLMNINGIGMVLLDLTSKPPGTIEWE